MGAYQDEGQAIASINVTPLVDVVLVLLVIFMVTAPMIAAQGILVDSPPAKTGVTLKSQFTMSITDTGELIVQDQEGTQHRYSPESRADALSLVVEFHSAFPDEKIVIAGHKDVGHGIVMEIVDMVRSVGIEKFALQTKMPIAPAKSGQ